MKTLSLKLLYKKFGVIIIFVFLTACGTDEEKTPPVDPDAPVLGAIGDKSVLPGNTLTIAVSATDVNDDDLVFSATAMGTDPSTLNPAASFIVDLSQTSATYTWSPSTMQTGDYVVNFTVTDNSSDQLSDSESITISVLDAVGQGRILYRDNCTGSSCHTFEKNGVGRFGIGAPTPMEMQQEFIDVGVMSGFQNFFTLSQLQQMYDYFCSLEDNDRC